MEIWKMIAAVTPDSVRAEQEFNWLQYQTGALQYACARVSLFFFSHLALYWVNAFNFFQMQLIEASQYVTFPHSRPLSENPAHPTHLVFAAAQKKLNV